jgi:ribosomal protein S18 acetylase RimI-like enzyme
MMRDMSESSVSSGKSPGERTLSALALSMLALADVVPSWRASSFGKVTAVFSGIPVPFLNMAVMPSGPAARSDLEAALDWLAAFGLPYSAQLAVDGEASLRDAVQARGLVAGERVPGMLLELAGMEPPVATGGLVVRRVDDQAAREEHLDVFCAGFGMAREMAEPIFAAVVPPPEGLEVLTGYQGGQAVATAMGCVIGDTVAVFNVATLPERRRQGLGFAMTWAAIGFGLARGCTAAVLQSSPDGLSVYQRMGFRDVAPVTLYVSG